MTAERLIRFYPRAWRERYGAEFLDTVGPQRLHPQQVIDIAMGAIDAWLSADVRRSSAGVVAGAAPRGGPMTTMSKIVCRDSKLRMTTRDGLMSAAAMLASTLVIMTVGVMLRRSGSRDLGDAVVSLAFPMSMLVSMPFGVMKGQPAKAQALVLGVTFAILLAAGYISILSDTGPFMIRRLAFAIIRRYPPAWRERYEAEVCALVDQSGVRVGDLAELVRGLLTERAAELLLNDERPRRTIVFLGLLKPAFSMALIGTAALTGYALKRLTGPWSEGAQEAALVPFIAFVIVFMTVLTRKRRPWSSVEPAYSAPVGLLMLSALFVAVVVIQWGQLLGPSPDSAQHSFDWFYANRWWIWWGYLLGPVADLASSLWPAQRMLHALGMLSSAEAQILSNQKWVDGCHTMIALGVPSPLGEAEAQVAHWTRERDAAREQLHALGYRARFRT